MVSGVALVAIFFSMVTDAIVAARVEQALGRRKTPLSDHIVVVGLGDVGTRVAEELHRAGEGVVAVERDAEHEGIQSLQDHIQVIIADAHRETAMQQANFAQARAVIVTTTDDLISLRIAHQAEMFNPKLRTIVRIYDSALANKLGSGLGIQRAVNAAQTAASTFVACALAERVEQSFMLGDRLLAIRRLPAAESKADAAACCFEGGLVLEEYDPCTRTWNPPTCQCTRNQYPTPNT
jgi:voltage-gated potassium channel Kch